MACQFGNDSAPRNKHNCCMCAPHIELRRRLAVGACRLRREKECNPQFEALAADPGYIEEIRLSPRKRGPKPGRRCKYGNGDAPRNKRGECMCRQHVEQRAKAFSQQQHRRMADPAYAEKMRDYKRRKAQEKRDKKEPAERAMRNELQRRRVARQRQQTPDLSPQDKASLDAFYQVAAQCNAIIKRLYLGKPPRQERYVVDHTLPLALGGLHEPGNLQIIKEWSNLRKSDRPWGRFVFETGRFEFEP